MTNPPQTSILTPRFETALVYATQLHATQVRKGSRVPYISHLMSVAALVLEDGGSEDEAIAALLHDAVEDQGGETTRAEILQRFGPEVMAIVDCCTEPVTFPKRPWRERKEAYLQQMKTASPSVLRVAMADKLHNARSIARDYQLLGETVWEKFNGGKSGTLWFYQSFLQLLPINSESLLAWELRNTVNQLKSTSKNTQTKSCA